MIVKERGLWGGGMTSPTSDVIPLIELWVWLGGGMGGIGGGSRSKHGRIEVKTKLIQDFRSIYPHRRVESLTGIV